MDKDLKKCYDILNLSIDAKIQDVEMRKNAMLKIYSNKSQEKGVSFDKQITLIETSSSKIIENLNNNGTPTEDRHYFETSWKSIGVLCLVLLFVAVFCYFSFYIFL